MTFEEWWNNGNYPKGGFADTEQHEQDKELAQHAWTASIKTHKERIEELERLLEIEKSWVEKYRNQFIKESNKNE